MTPGFAWHWWEGPNGPDIPPGPAAGSSAASLRRLSRRGMEAADHAAGRRRPGVSRRRLFRFRKGHEKALRYTGHGLLVLSLSPSFKIEAGIVYLDRIEIKMLPAGGIVWTPTARHRVLSRLPLSADRSRRLSQLRQHRVVALLPRRIRRRLVGKSIPSPGPTIRSTTTTSGSPSGSSSTGWTASAA